jgi:hypothetical protein
VNKFKEHIATKAITILLACLLLVPASAKFAHIFSNHKHDICYGKKISHLHELNTDCDLHKFKLSQSYVFNIAVFELISSSKKAPLIIFHPQYLINYQNLQTALRGPPVLI